MDVHYRVYGKLFRDEATERENGTDDDGWHKGRGGFRLDKGADGNFVVQSDAYNGRKKQADDACIELRGLKLMKRWKHALAEDSQLQPQAYYDRTEHDWPGLLDETLNIVDLEPQHNLRAGDRHEIVWDAGYRGAWDDVHDANSAPLLFKPRGC